MKLLGYPYLLFSLFLLMTGCNQTAPEITISDIWSRPVELVGEANHNPESANSENAKPACCAQDEKTAEKPACCTSNVNGVVYMQIKNNGGQPDRLLNIKSDIANVVEIHESKMEADHMSMQKIDDGIEIPAGGTVTLKPGSYHVMLIGLKQALKIDDEFNLELEFEKSPAMTVKSKVRLY